MGRQSNQARTKKINPMQEIIERARSMGPIDKPYTCQYCGKGYVKESTLSSHLCEPKRRHQQRSEKGVVIGFQAYQRFFQHTQNSLKTKTYEEFAKSPYYGAFVKFGRYVHNLNAVKPERFVEWIVRSNKKLDRWCRDEYYLEYLQDYIRKENPQDALERTVLTASKWAEETGSQVNHYFLYASTNRIVQSITNGRISPWAIYCSKSGVEMLEKLNEEQIVYVYPWIDPEYWQRRLISHSDDAEFCRTVLGQAGF